MVAGGLKKRSQEGLMKGLRKGLRNGLMKGLRKESTGVAAYWCPHSALRSRDSFLTARGGRIQDCRKALQLGEGQLS